MQAQAAAASICVFFFFEMRSSMHAWIHSIPGALFGLGESILFV
jgi:hypothetical protein